MKRAPDPLMGAVAGLVAGLAASFAMGQFQKLRSLAGSDEGSGGDPATVRAANKASRIATGRSIEKERKRRPATRSIMLPARRSASPMDWPPNIGRK
jgi:hypothetical protein